MTLNELRDRIQKQIDRFNNLPEDRQTDWQAGKSIGFVAVLQWLDEPITSDLTCKKCGGRISHTGAFYCSDEAWRCDDCGTRHHVDTIQTCRLEDEDG